MNEYTCDNWVVIKMKGDDPHYRLLTGTSGGYLYGDSWRMNSGIIKVEEEETFYYFYGSSGSSYCCYKESYTLRMNIRTDIQQVVYDAINKNKVISSN